MTRLTARSLQEPNLVSELRSLAKNLERDPADITLDLSSLRRVNSQDVLAIEELVRVAEEKEVKVTLRGVNVPIYRALKLVKLTNRFSSIQ